MYCLNRPDAAGSRADYTFEVESFKKISQSLLKSPVAIRNLRRRLKLHICITADDWKIEVAAGQKILKIQKKIHIRSMLPKI